MNKRLKWIYVVGLLLLIVVVSACSSDNNANNGNGGGGGGGDTTPAANSGTSGNDDPVNEDRGEPVDLSIITQNHNAWPYKDDWIVYDLLAEHNNVNLDVSTYVGDWWDAIPLVIAGGDMPDFMWMSGSGNYNRYGADGALLDLMEHLDQLPNMVAWMDQYPGIVEDLMTYDGKLYMQPTHGGHPFNNLFLYREDIFEAEGIPSPATYDELYDALLTLKERYPDSYPLYAASIGIITRFAPNFNTHMNWFYDREANEWSFGPLTDGYKTIVEFLVNAYEDRLIPLEFGNMDNQKRDELIYNNNTFIVPGFINNIDTFNMHLREENPNAKFAVMNPPAGTHGAFHEYQYMSYAGLTITSTTENKDAALAFLDSFYTEEVRDFLSWGKEGVTFEYVDGEKQYLPDVITDANTRSIDYGIRTSGVTAWFDPDANIAVMDEEGRENYQRALDFPGAPPLVPSRLSPEDISEIELKSEAIGSHVDETVSRFIVGQRDMSEWDQFIQELENLGVHEVLEVYQNAHERFEAQQ